MHRCCLTSPPCRLVQPGSATAQMSAPQQCLTCPQDTKHWVPVEGNRREGCFLHAAQPCCCPALPAPGLPCGWACAVGRSSGLHPRWHGHPCAFLPAGGLHVLPHGRMGCEGCFPQQRPHLTPAWPPLAGHKSWAPLCPTSAFSQLLSGWLQYINFYLSLSVWSGQMLSKEGCSLQTVPKLGFNSKQNQ